MAGRKPLPKDDGDNGPAKLDLENINTTFLLCRQGMVGHSWEWTGDYDLTENTRGRIIQATRVFTCARCGTIKQQQFSLPSLEPMDGVRMKYPRGYLSTHRIYALEVRREHWNRTR